MMQQSKHFSPYGSSSYILKHKQAHFVHTCSSSTSKGVSRCSSIWNQFRAGGVLQSSVVYACCALTSFRDWLWQRKDARGGNCQESWGLAQGWCSVLCGHAGREGSGQIWGLRGFHSLHTRDSSALVCCQTCWRSAGYARPSGRKWRRQWWHLEWHKWALWYSCRTRGFHVHPLEGRRMYCFALPK